MLVKKQPKSPLRHNTKGGVYLANGDVKNARVGVREGALARSRFRRRNLQSGDARRRRTQSAGRQKALRAGPRQGSEVGSGDARDSPTSDRANAPRADVDAAIRRAIAANPGVDGAQDGAHSLLRRQKDWKAAIAAAPGGAGGDPRLAADPRGAGGRPASHRAKRIRRSKPIVVSRKLQPDNPSR